MAKGPSRRGKVCAERFEPEAAGVALRPWVVRITARQRKALPPHPAWKRDHSEHGRSESERSSTFSTSAQQRWHTNKARPSPLQ